MISIQKMLDDEVANRNQTDELSYERPDPLLVASRYRDESIALICALFGYGNAKLIVQFLDSLDFKLLDAEEETIRESLTAHHYRFQNAEDIAVLFIALKRLREIGTIEDIFYHGYRSDHAILEGLWHFIKTLRRVYPYESRGYDFLVGRVPQTVSRAGTYKRYMMYLRWMVRRDHLDMGLWSKIDKKDLIMPLDTHTFHLSKRLGLLKRKSYDLKAALELTARLKVFDADDPVKYDFALYRLGQEQVLK